MIFETLKHTLRESIFGWDYFTDFDKVTSNVQKIEVELNILNYLLGKENIEDEFIKLVLEYPKIRRALHILIAVRKSKLKETSIVTDKENLIAENKTYIFYDEITDSIKEELLIFFRESGLKNIFENKKIKNLVDYCLGVEVGLDTNARKNRTGKIMEGLCELKLLEFSIENNFTLLREVTKKEIYKQFGIDVHTNVDSKEKKNDRRFDFVLFNQISKKLFIFEVNYYSSSGSKPNSIAREYIDLYKLLQKQNIEFVWITDGHGWYKMLNALEQTVKNNKFVINLDMLKNGILDEICK